MHILYYGITHYYIYIRYLRKLKKSCKYVICFRTNCNEAFNVRSRLACVYIYIYRQLAGIPAQNLIERANFIYSVDYNKSEMEKYNSLRQDFLSTAEPFVNDNVLDKLKKHYERNIDSNRKLSRTNNFKTLVRLLEKRNVVNYDNIEQFLYISKTYVDNPDLDRKLLEYQSWMQTMPSFCNMYQSDYTSVPLVQGNITEDPISRTFDASVGICNLSQTSIQNSTTRHILQESLYCKQEKENDEGDSLQQDVLLHVSERLGRAWRDVARHLGIRECEIDAVQNKYPNDQKEQSYEILKMYMSQCDKKRWTIDIPRALEKGRRKDLRELVEELTLKDKNS